MNIHSLLSKLINIPNITFVLFDVYINLTTLTFPYVLLPYVPVGLTERDSEIPYRK